jgi:hypothetical protein
MDLPGWMHVWGPDVLGGAVGALVAVLAALFIASRNEERVAKRIVDYEHEKATERERMQEMLRREDRARQRLLPRLSGHGTGDFREFLSDPDFAYLPCGLQAAVRRLIDAEPGPKDAAIAFGQALDECFTDSCDDWWKRELVDAILELEPDGWSGALGGPGDAAAFVRANLAEQNSQHDWDGFMSLAQARQILSDVRAEVGESASRLRRLRADRVRSERTRATAYVEFLDALKRTTESREVEPS